MPYNLDALIHEKQVVINSTGDAGVSSGSLIVEGGLSTKDTYVKGHVSVNNVKITPNLNDIVFEQQASLTPDTSVWTDITDFYFSNSVANTFKANVNVTVSSGSPKYALYEIYGVYKNTGWHISYTFTGDVTGISFGITTANGVGQIQYQNSNPIGTNTTIRFRAQTTAPAGTSPTGSTGIINNTSGPYIPSTLLYANTANTMAGADVTYDSSVLKVGGATRMVIDNTSTFTNYTNGGSLTAMGAASVAKNLIVGQRIGIANTAPGFSIDVSGDVNFTGNLYKNGTLYSGSSIWDTNAYGIFNTTGNVGVGTTQPTVALDVVGSAKITGSITAGGAQLTSVAATDAVITNVTISNAVLTSASGTNASFTNVTASGAQLTSITGTNAVITNVSASSAVLTSASGTNASFTNVTASGAQLTSITGTNAVITNVSASSAVLTSASGTNASFTNVTASGAQLTSIAATDAVITNISSSSAVLSSASGTNANFTNITASGAQLTSITGTNAVITNVSASSAVLTSASGTNASFTNVTASSAILTSASGTNANFTNITIGNLQDLTVSGNLTVSGTTTTVNTETVTIEDNLLVINSGPAGLADGGLLVKRYQSGTSGSVDYAGMFYKESTDEITLAMTASDPGTNSVSINNYLPLRASKISLESTDNAVSSSNGGALTVPGGAAIIKDLYVGGSITASSASLSGVLNATGINVTGGISATGISVTGGIAATGNLTNGGFDFILGNADQVSRGDSGSSRALVKNISNKLVINFGGDFAGGVDIGGTSVSHSGTIGSTAYTGGNMQLSGSITASSAQLTNIVVTNITGSNIGATTYTGGSLNLSGTIRTTTNSEHQFISVTGGSYMYMNTVSTSNTSGFGRIGVWNSNVSGDGSQHLVLQPVGTSGNVGIGTTAPTYKLHVNGNIYATGDITALSDMRRKTDIVTIDEALNKVEQLRGVYFKSLVNERKNVGVIAQEIEEVLPEVVLTDSEGYKSVAYGNIAGILIEAIKELSEKVKILEQKQCNCQ
jgi:uncharacterized protein YjbI with pentapeptide repeats